MTTNDDQQPKTNQPKTTNQPSSIVIPTHRPSSVVLEVHRHPNLSSIQPAPDPDPGSPRRIEQCANAAGHDLGYATVRAAQRAQEMGVARVASMADGMLAWKEAGGPVEPAYALTGA